MHVMAFVRQVQPVYIRIFYFFLFFFFTQLVMLGGNGLKMSICHVSVSQRVIPVIVPSLS